MKHFNCHQCLYVFMSWSVQNKFQNILQSAKIYLSDICPLVIWPSEKPSPVTAHQPNYFIIVCKIKINFRKIVYIRKKSSPHTVDSLNIHRFIYLPPCNRCLPNRRWLNVMWRRSNEKRIKFIFALKMYENTQTPSLTSNIHEDEEFMYSRRVE